MKDPAAFVFFIGLDYMGVAAHYGIGARINREAP
jgi:hypothetical protein